MVESNSFDAPAFYQHLLEADETKPMPIAAIETLAEVIDKSKASTMTELMNQLQDTADTLKAHAFNSISLSAGVNLLLRFVTLQRSSLSIHSFDAYKRELAKEARAFVKGSQACSKKIIQEAASFINDGSVVLTHSYSRLVSQTLLHAARISRKRFSVYVTEARPFGLGVRTHAILTKAGIPCTIILDSAVAYAMGRTDLVLMGAEGVAESGGTINAIGSYGIALAAKALDRPVYFLAESFKFLRLFPLSQYDLPSAIEPLQFSDATSSEKEVPSCATRLMKDSAQPKALEMTLEQIEQNPLLDYSTPDLIRGIISDVGILTPSAVADTLLSIFGGE